MKRKFSLKKLSKKIPSLTAFVVIGVMALVISAGAAGYERVFNIENYYEATPEQSLGGQVHNTPESFDAGILVNGVEVISSQGYFEGTIATSASASIGGSLTVKGAATTGAFTGSSTMAITGSVTLSSNETIAGNLGVGTTSVASTLIVDEQTATTSIQFGSAISTTCFTIYADYNKTIYYIDFSKAAEGSLRNFATTTKPGWCS